MSAETFAGGAIQLADLHASGLVAPFPVFREVRKRSSSLGAAQHLHIPPPSNNQAGAVTYIDAGSYPFVDREMPGLWRKGKSKSIDITGNGDSSNSSSKDGAVSGNRQKITDKGRERRLSSAGAGVLHHLRLAKQTTSQDVSTTRRSAAQREDGRKSSSDADAMQVDGQDAHARTREDAGVTPFSANSNSRALYASALRDPAANSGSSSSNDENEDEAVTEQRAIAYAALTGARPSPHGTRARVKSELTKARSPTSGSSAIPRRRTTSSNDAPTMAERSSKLPAVAADKVFDRSPASRTARSRVQSANAAAITTTNGSTSAPTAEMRRKRRSLSQQNSLIATRLSAAFLARELGEAAIKRRPVNSPRQTWSTDESEQRDLWLALHDGVVLCRLLNHLVPSAIKYIDRRDISSARTANITNFLASAKLHLPIQPHEFFEVSQLSSGTSSGFERVLHTICAIAEYVMLQRHASLNASRSSESLIGSPLTGHLGSPPLSSAPLSAARASPVAIGYAAHLRSTSPMSLDSGDHASAVSPTLSTEASSGTRPSTLLSSASGARVRSRVTSKAAEDVHASPLVRPPRTPNSSRPTSSDSKRTASITFAAPSSSTEHALARKPGSHHGVYGNHGDRRMSESAVDIMTVVREGEEMPSPRRAASDRPRGDLNGAGRDVECTPVKRLLDAQRKAAELLHSQSDATTSSNIPSGLPRPVRPLRSRHQSTSSIGSGTPASIADQMGLRSSPRLVRKRFSSSSSGSERAGTPIRATSVSPTTPSTFSDPATTPTHVPFPRGGSYLSRSKTSNGPKRMSDIPTLSIEPETDPDEDEHSPSPQKDPILAKSQPISSSRKLAPLSPSAIRPRQHKRWNSEVHIQSSEASKLASTPRGVRSRHDSFLPSPHSLPSSPSLGPVREKGRPTDLRRRSTDKRQSFEGSRERLVVKELGKPAVTYQLGECIGRGQFGSVYRALNIHTGSVMAIKRIFIDGKSEQEIVQLQREVDLLKSLSHPSVVKYEGLVRTEHFVNIVLEYVENGSLQHTLASFAPLPEPLVQSYMVKILEGLVYLHSMHVIHRDLKCANILTTKKGNIKLSDFGVSLQLNAVYNTIENADATGTPNWMAPEVIKLERATYASDIWSLACVCVELLTGKPPYSDLLAMTAMFKIVEDDMPPLPENCSPELVDFLQLCFAKEPEDRPTAEMLFEHAWLRKHWQAHKNTLRPQDSIPFIRRISSEYTRRPAFAREASVASDVPDLDRSISSPGNSSLLSDEPMSPHMRPIDPLVFDADMASTGPSPSLTDADAIVSDGLLFAKAEEPRQMAFSMPDAFPFPRDVGLAAQEPTIGGAVHSFVRTVFGRPIACRVCGEEVQKYAILCEECGLFCHPFCQEFVPLPCEGRLGSSSMAPKASPISIPGSVTSPTLACSVPLLEPSPLTSPSQFAYHPRFGFGRKPKASPTEEVSPSGEPLSKAKGFALLRSRTSSPDRFGLPLRPRPASYASSSSMKRSREGNASSVSGSSDSHPLAETSFPDGRDIDESASSAPVSKPALLARRSFSGGRPKPVKVKHGKKESSGDCIVS